MSKLSIHISGNPTGLDSLLQKCAQANSPIPVIYSVNQNIADSIARHSPGTRWIYRRQTELFNRLPPDWYTGNPEESARNWLAGSKDPADKRRTQVENWALNRADWYDPLNEPVIEIADPANPEQVADAVRKAQWLNTWMMTALTIADDHGFKLALFSFPTGSPPLRTWNEVNTSQIQVPPNPECQAVVWHYLLPALRHGKRSGAVLSLHAYWEDKDPSVDHDDALLYRDLMRILPSDAQLPIVISEASSGNGYGVAKNTGQGQPWVDDMAKWDSELMKDPIVLSGCAFQVGGQESKIPLEVLEKYGDYIRAHPTPAEPPDVTRPPEASPEGTMVPPNPTITDSAGHVWSLGDSDGAGRRLLRDGTQFAGGQGVLLLFHNQKVFTRNSQNEWFVAAADWQSVPGDPRSQPAISDQLKGSAVSNLQSASVEALVKVSGQSAVFGIHGGANLGDLSPRDLAIMRLVATRVTGYKFMTGHSRSHYDSIINDVKIPAANCMTRLFVDMLGHSAPPKPADFVDVMVGAIQDAWGFGIRWYELHNEPNLFKEWKESWGGAPAFVAWAKEVIDRLKSRPEWNGIKIVSPGLSPHDNDAVGQHTDAWINVFATEGLFAVCDAVGAHAYWGNRQSMLTPQDGLNFHRYFAHTDKPIWLTEFSNNQPGDSNLEKGQQYRDYLNFLRQNEPRVERAYCFVLSGTDFDGSKETWSRDDPTPGIPAGVME